MAFLQVSFFSYVLGCGTSMNVILPQTTNRRGMIGVDSPDFSATTYPVLYLLHGMSDDHTIWSRRTSIDRYADEMGIAVVMPTTELGWYTNMKHGRKWRQFIGEELPAVCHDFFPRISTRREDTFIAGLSMGGYGAYALAMTYPEQYGAAAGLSGAYIPYDKLAQEDNPFWTDIFGTKSEFTDSENDLIALSEKLCASDRPKPRLFMWCGTEDFIYTHSTTMRDHLQAIGWQDFHYEESSGTHCWKYWDDKIQAVLAWLR